jgi:hypothetical protein
MDGQQTEGLASDLLYGAAEISKFIFGNGNKRRRVYSLADASGLIYSDDSQIGRSSSSTVQRVVDLALGPPPGESTHWTGRELAKAAGVSLRSVQRILEAHQLAPHCIRTFKLSKDPEFVEKLGTSSVSMSILPPTPSSSRLMRRVKSRRSTAPSPVCR